MKKAWIILLAAFIWPVATQAQLSKLMSKYHEQNCVTVTQLDKSLYSLYQKTNLPAEAGEMLQKLDEVNLLNLNLPACRPEMAAELAGQFRKILDNPDKYKLIKSHNDSDSKQLIYTQSKNGKVSGLVVWNQNPERLDIIELKGDIQLDKIALLSKALNLKGLNSLAALSSNPESFEAYKHHNDFAPGFNEDMTRQMQEMQKLMQHFQQEFRNRFRSPGQPGMPEDTTRVEEFGFPFGDQNLPEHFTHPFGNMEWPEDGFGFENMFPEEMEEFFKGGNGIQHKMQKFYRSFGDDADMSSNSVQITEENGKTKIKIDSRNADMTYIIDGQQAPKDNVQMPESILNVNIIPSKEDIKKSYLFITSKDQLGNFVSLKDGVLTFTYNNQEYRYNLEKNNEPLLVINGRLARHFDLDPSLILQIRPISQIEKEIGYYPNAEVIINLK